MSRLVVKNLPKHVTKELLQETFSQKGIVTDVQLKYTQDGKFRHFGFVGFKSAEDAAKAMDYFDNSFINASRIRVEMCTDLDDVNKPKAWCDFNKDVREKVKKRLALKQSEAVKVPTAAVPAVDPKDQSLKMLVGDRKVNEKVAEMISKHKDDPLFREFMEVHAGGNKNIWDNDLIMGETTKKENKKSDQECESVNGQKSDDLEEVPEKEKKLAEEQISDLEYLKRKTVSSSESDHKPGEAGRGFGETTKEDARSIGEDTSEPEGTEEKPQRIKTLKKKKEYVNYFTVKISGLPFTVKKKELKVFFHPLKLASVRVPPKASGYAFIGLKTEAEMQKALSKDKSFVGGNRVKVATYIKKKVDDEDVQKDPKWRAQELSLKGEEDVSETGRIFVRNLSYATTEEDLEVLFHQFGDTTEVSLPIDRNTRASKGFAHVTFLMPEHAAKAFKSLDGTVFKGRMLHLLRGKSKMSLEEAMEQDGLSFSAKKDLKQKFLSGSSHNWNSLFLGINTVADVMASTYNTTKEQVLDGQGNESLAVRLALGETQIVTQTREFLVKNGVRLDAFNQTVKQRSKRVVLVKNLPANTTEKELVDLFAPHAELQRVILPPNGVTAIIEFTEPAEARTAFTRLAYTKFKNLPLYLEWAPLHTLCEPSTKEEPATDSSTQNKNKKNNTTTSTAHEHSNSERPETEAEDQNEPPEPDTTLYIKNINFKTTEQDLKEHFKQCGLIHSTSIAYQSSKGDLSKSLSKGYGFVQFKKNASALKALSTLQGVRLQQHALELKPSHRTVSTEVASARKKTVIGEQNGSKILVRNIPFQANYQEIKDLFKTFGDLKAVRLPKKMTGTGPHRGFVFVEYESKSDAKRAFEALSQSTHLYGRRLVLEWAAKDDDVDDLRKRTANQYFTGSTSAKTMRPSTMNLDDEKMQEYE